MGCDIHAQIDWDEYDKGPDGVWEQVIWYGEISLPRAYRMFGALVQGHSRYPDDNEAPPERGKVKAWPDGDDRYDPDKGMLGDHTFSWVTLPELDAAIARFEKHWEGESYRTYEYRAVAEMMRELEKSGHKTRFVFGFDN